MRKVNQDAYFYQKDFAGIKNLWCLGVMDGHGVNGHMVSAFVKANMPVILQYLMKGATVPDLVLQNNKIVNKKGKGKSSLGGNQPNNGFLPSIAGRGSGAVKSRENSSEKHNMPTADGWLVNNPELRDKHVA